MHTRNKNTSSTHRGSRIDWKSARAREKERVKERERKLPVVLHRSQTKSEKKSSRRRGRRVHQSMRYPAMKNRKKNAKDP